MAGRNGSSLEHYISSMDPSQADRAIARDVDGVVLKVDGLDTKLDALDSRMYAQHTQLRDEVETAKNSINRRMTTFAMSLFTASLVVTASLITFIVTRGG